MKIGKSGQTLMLKAVFNEPAWRFWQGTRPDDQNECEYCLDDIRSSPGAPMALQRRNHDPPKMKLHSQS